MVIVTAYVFVPIHLNTEKDSKELKISDKIKN